MATPMAVSASGTDFLNLEGGRGMELEAEAESGRALAAQVRGGV
jgi:hypothetical protein